MMKYFLKMFACLLVFVVVTPIFAEATSFPIYEINMVHYRRNEGENVRPSILLDLGLSFELDTAPVVRRVSIEQSLFENPMDNLQPWYNYLQHTINYVPIGTTLTIEYVNLPLANQLIDVFYYIEVFDNEFIFGELLWHFGDDIPQIGDGFDDSQESLSTGWIIGPTATLTFDKLGTVPIYVVFGQGPIEENGELFFDDLWATAVVFEVVDDQYMQQLLEDITSSEEKSTLNAQQPPVIPTDSGIDNGTDNRPITVYVFGEIVTFDVLPQIINGRTMLPMRAVFEALDATEIGWDQDSATASAYFVIDDEDVSIYLTIGIDFLKRTWGQLEDELVMDVPPQIVDGRTLIPLRAVADALLIDVEWDPKTSTVYIGNNEEDIDKATDIAVDKTTTETESTDITTENVINETTEEQTSIEDEKPPVIEETEDITLFAQQVLELTNQERAAYGLAPLIWDPMLASAAHNHSVDMATNNNLSHTGTSGSTVGDRIAAVGITNIRSWAENVAAGQRTPEAVVQSWMNSPGHRANILGNTTHIGIGVAFDSSSPFGYFWTQKFVSF